MAPNPGPKTDVRYRSVGGHKPTVANPPTAVLPKQTYSSDENRGDYRSGRQKECSGNLSQPLCSVHGAAKSARQDANRREVENFAARLEVLPFDTAAAHHAADIRATLERQGRTIGGYDILIAGHARSRALVVVTGNRGEFDRVPGLQCEDWG